MGGKILHLLWTGGIGGIEKLCRDIADNAHEKHIFCCVNSGGELYDEMRERGHKIDCLGYRNHDLFRLVKYVCNCIKIKQISAIVVHHDATMVWIAVGLIKILIPRVKVAVYAHCNYQDFIGKDHKKKIIFHYTARLCDYIIAISNSVKDSVLRNEPNLRQKIHVIYNGIDFSEYYVERGNEQTSLLKIVYVGRLIEEKGIQVLLNALALIKDTVEFQCDIVGDGSYRSQLEDLAKRCGLEDRVWFHGKRKNVVDYLRVANIFVHPAIWEEGFGITLIEAMASGIPCIAFCKGAIPEIIDDGQDGFLVDVLSSEALASRIRDVSDLLVRHRLVDIGKNASKKAKRFSCVTMVTQIEELLGLR